MKTAYLDAFSGLSGDMLVGALLDAGADFEALRAALLTLGVGGYELAIERRTLSGISAAKFGFFLPRLARAVEKEQRVMYHLRIARPEFHARRITFPV